MVQVIDRLTSELADNAELFDMAKDEGDEQGMQSIEGEAAKVAVEVEKMEFRRMFNNPADPLNCFLDVQSGAGGTEACDWASMLLRQYLKYAERKGYTITVNIFIPSPRLRLRCTHKSCQVAPQPFDALSLSKGGGLGFPYVNPTYNFFATFE